MRGTGILPVGQAGILPARVRIRLEARSPHRLEVCAPLQRRARGNFPADHGAFADRVPAIIPEDTGLANHAVTRDDEGDRICANRAANSAGGLRLV